MSICEKCLEQCLLHSIIGTRGPVYNIHALGGGEVVPQPGLRPLAAWDP